MEGDDKHPHHNNIKYMRVCFTSFMSRGVRTHKLTKLNGYFRSKTKNHNMRVRLGSSPCHRILRWLFKRFFSKEVKKATSNIRNSAKDKITFLHPICDM